MARSSRPLAEDEDEQQSSSGNALQFHESLSWKAGKPIPTGTLIARLKALSKELVALEQEAVDRDSLATPAKELVSVGLLQHKDNGVKAYTACCLADMLRLHAPDAPYTAVQLRDIFELFVRQLKGLADAENPYYQQYLYLLESLASVKSVVLISDIPNGEAITLKIFTTFFDLAKPDGPKNVEYQMTDILIQLIEECNSLPTEVVDIIVAQFFRVNQAALQNLAGKKAKPGVPDAKDKGAGMASKGKDEDKQMKLVSVLPPPAYNMAKSICNASVDKMARHICQYFSEVILDASPSSRARKAAGRHTSMSPDSDLDDPDAETANHEPSAEDLHELHKAHLLVKELWKACPAVLQNVIPQLEQELLAENADLRILATETIGDMALTGNFGSSAPVTWKAWIGRSNDRSNIVRSKWAEAAIKIIKERSDLMAVQLVEPVAGKLNDLDDRVRLTACISLGELDYTTITTKLGADLSPFNTYDTAAATGASTGKAKGKSKVTEEETSGWGKKILHNLGERVRDKKFSVRWEGMFCLARMWNMAYPDILSGNEVIMNQLGWIPSKILDTFYINDAEVNVLLDHVLFGVLIPVNYPPIEKSESRIAADKQANGKSNGKGKERDAAEAEKAKEKEIQEGDKIRVQRLLVLVRGLDPKAKKALFAVPLRQISYAKVMDVFLKSCEDYNGGVIEDGVEEDLVKKALHTFIEWLSQKLPDTPKSKENLMKFAKLHDRRCYQLIRFCFSPDSDYRTVVKALKEIKKRITEAPGSAMTIMETLTPLLYRVSQLIYNKSHVPHIVEFSRTDEHSLGAVAHEVLKEMSSSNPAVFKANVKALSDLLQEQSSSKNYGAADSGAVDTLRACAGFAKSYPKDMPQERKLLDALVNFSLTGKPPAAAKHAVSILMYSANRKVMYASDLLRACVKNFKFGEEHFLAKLACLSQLVLLAPEQCEDESKGIIAIAKDVLFKVRNPATEEDQENAKEWVDDEHLDDECKAKLLALRILVNRLRAKAGTGAGAGAGTTLESVMTLLIKLVNNEGELFSEKNTPRSHQSRLRLLAAQSLLKLSYSKPYDELITPLDFNRLACVAQDNCFEVRNGFVSKVKKYLGTNRLTARYYTILFLMAYEPVTEAKDEAVTWIKARMAHVRSANNTMEIVFARLLSLLAHHPDFGTMIDDLADFAKFILFYLKAVATEENLSLIYHIAQRVKQFRDGLSKDNSENLYYISELAQAVIRRYADFHHWSIQTWPGKIPLPAKLFAPMISEEMSRDIAMKTFLPEGIDIKLDSLIKPRSAGRQGKKRKPDQAAPSNRTPASATPARKRYKASPSTVTTPTTTAASRDGATTTTGTADKRKPGRPPKTPKQKKRPSAEISASERRRSARTTKNVKYVEDDGTSESEEEVSLNDDSESDVEMEDGDEVSEKEVSPEAPDVEANDNPGAKEDEDEEVSPEEEPEPEKPKRTRPVARPKRDTVVAVSSGRPKRKGTTTTNGRKKTAKANKKPLRAKKPAMEEDDDSSELSDPPSELD
ncbi:hypothetical protein L873DRAFT_1816416 [Choiromyces venosus 120613-1]|uniref:ARM repeat-containing protein n=1 Tax=Choiromyces venosus 120613-1 TaxID=1336337 RepID=A0A3N4JH24_9PEZI|nr:hypothetical protein L873DRAFT_1816416 [Choiromyces venosus 120613-1]